MYFYLLVIFTVFSFSAEKKLLLEYSGYPGCAPCPAGHIMMDRIEKKYSHDKVITISYEKLSPMEVVSGLIWDDFYENASPSVTVNRMNHKKKAFSSKQVDSLKYIQMVEEEVAKTTLANIEIKHIWNNKTRELKGYVEVVFDRDTILNNPHIGIVYVRDSISKPSSTYYNQSNSLRVTGRANGSAYFPELIGVSGIGYTYKMVYMGALTYRNYLNIDTKEIIPTEYIWGDSSAIPDTVKAGVSYKIPFSKKLPRKYLAKNSHFSAYSTSDSIIFTEEKMHLVATVSNHKNIIDNIYSSSKNDENGKTIVDIHGETVMFPDTVYFESKQLLNATRKALIDDTTDIEIPIVIEKETNLSKYNSNHSNYSFTVNSGFFTLNSNSSFIQIHLFNHSGQILGVFNGTQSVNLNLFNESHFFIRIQNKSHSQIIQYKREF